MKLPDFLLERYLAKHEFSAPYLLGSSDCESMTLEYLASLEKNGAEEFGKVWLGYTESQGHPDLRAAIAKQYEGVHPSEILVHSGAEEAIFNLMNSQLSPSDHVIVHWPCYQSLVQIAESIGCEVTRWEANPLEGWALDVDFLKSSIKSNTRMVVLNVPHNPTGYLMNPQDFSDVVDILDQQCVTLLVDEVYRGLEYDSKDRLPAVCELSQFAVSLGVMSKSFGLAGLRIGWVATHNKKLLKHMASYKDYTTICNSAPSEFLATLALRNAETIVGRNKQIIKKNLVHLDLFFENERERFDWVRPKAGCIGFPRMNDDDDCDRLVEELLENRGVLLAPGSQFRYPGPHFRIGFGRNNFAEGLKLAWGYLKRTPNL